MSLPRRSLPDGPRPEDHRSGWLRPFVFLLGLGAWIAAGVTWSMMDEAEAVDVIRYQTLAIVLSVVGAGLVIIATSVRRHEPMALIEVT